MKIPRHLAVIMDGNGRWARARGLERIQGHYEGVKRAEELVDSCLKLGIEYLTLFTFSTENWKRPKEEVRALFSMFEAYLMKKKDELREKGVRVKFIGRRDRLPTNLLEVIRQVEETTASCNRLKLFLAVDYGGRDEIVRAVNKAIKAGLNFIDEETFRHFLDMGDAPEPDLLIRTGGEKRISNFLLWYIAYTELYFTDTFWPDFDEKELLKALKEFSRRIRKFGAIVEK
ncbi:polyprenyl diphosphate synthase [Thermocrinis minervae]|uniref:Isoprenyl transferase n=1 Tax=Thermocrinis minervae TaxID=381751 RepID=A0A1M6R033_9AQUI|nr:polyprenyl diphosphate synthase [Thermocrinis minervae]SHK25760.1 undecaprenyl diphosphate synthase [Thermocrinis minervae]